MRHSITALTVALLLGIPAWPAHADTYPKNPNIDVLNYVFRLTLADETNELVGETTIDLRFLTAGLNTVELDLIGLPPDGAGKGMVVSRVTIGGKPVTFTHQSDRLRITLPTPSNARQRLQIMVAYHGVPAAGLEIGPNAHGERTFYSNNWPNKARHWLPTIDHPYDKATSETVVTAPAHYQVVASGRLVEQTDLPGGTRLTHWKQSVPIATWLNALGVAHFAVQHLPDVDGIPIQSWVHAPEREIGLRNYAEPVRDVVRFYSETIGPFPYEKLANVESASRIGGMELASAIFYGESSANQGGTRWRNVFIHEIAHQWFGDSVTEYDWDDVWLSEGFATYFTLLFQEHAYGRDEFVAGLKRSRQTVLDFDVKNPAYRVVHDNLADMSKVLTGHIYQKGGWTLHMLRGIVGTPTFWAGIREYYREYRDGSATTADFKRIMEEASGLDLSWFFQQWLYRGGRLKVEGTWRYNAAAKQVEIELNQEQPEGDPFRMPIEIGMTFAEEPRLRLEKIELKDRRQAFSIAADKEPTEVVLDPNVWALMDATLVKRSLSR